LATISAAMISLAPGLLSMMKGWPQLSDIDCPIARNITSAGPPAEYGTTIRIGLLG
jgi:hypothetical protein